MPLGFDVPEIPTDAWVALLGAAVGWALAFVSQLGVGFVDRRRTTRTAARLVLAELVEALANFSTLSVFGSGATAEQMRRRTAWDAWAHNLALHRGGLDRLGKIAMAYSALEDIAAIVDDPDWDFAGEDNAFLEHERDVIERGAREVALLAGKSRDAIERDFAAIREQEQKLRASLKRPS